jgi:hypothetical protein
MKREEIPSYLRSRFAEFNKIVEDSYVETSTIMISANTGSKEFFVDTFPIVFNKRFDKFLRKDDLYLVDLNEYKVDRNYWFSFFYEAFCKCDPISHVNYGYQKVRSLLVPISEFYIIL